VAYHFYSEREVHMNADQKDVNRGFWLQWVLASAIGFGVGAILASGLSYALFPRDTFDIVIGVSFGILFGSVGGLAQWLVLRQQFTGVGLWVPVSALGFMIATGIAAGIVQPVASSSNTLAFLFAGIFGVIGGLIQWLVLRMEGMGMGWWLVPNLLGSLLGIALGIPVVNAMSTANYDFGLFVLFGAAFGAGLGIITAWPLDWLLRHPQSASRVEAAPSAQKQI
jgi:hypothetical protein